MIEKKYDVSVIIPIYNKEKHLKKCIDSVVNQTLKKIEIILVDDGSTDKSEEICLKYLSQKNIIYKKIENSGVSVARNIGMNLSSGKYVIFLDSDDYIEKNMLEKMYESIEANDGDLIICGIVEENEETKVEIDYGIKNLKENKKYTKEQIIKINPILLHSCGNKLFKKEKIVKNEIKFLENCHSREDWNFVFKYLINSETCYLLKNPLYFYCRNIDSATKSKIKNNITLKVLKKAIEIDCENLKNIKNYISERKLDKEIDFFKRELDRLDLLNRNREMIQNSYVKFDDLKLEDIKKSDEIAIQALGEFYKTQNFKLKIRMFFLIIFRKILKIIYNLT